MTLDSVEQRLARYSPSAPPPGLRDEILDGVARRVARRRTRRILIAIFGAPLIAGALVQALAVNTYQQAMMVANGTSRPVPRRVMAAHAAAMGIRVPDAGMPRRTDGG